MNIATDGSLELTPGATYALDLGTLATGGTVQLRFNSDTDYSKFTLSGVPTFDADAGFLDLNFLDTMLLESSSSFVLSDDIGGVTGNLDTWLLDDFRYEWNLDWIEGTGLLLGRDANAVPEPTTWMMLVLGFVLVIWKRRSFASPNV
ncbi:MAG: PEP-CTERM sorting domain-containing protein [Planctomycetia bacterium]|nr:PEP-CTERM sorting domain-containing protein [Planctomycetia bacterium]